MRTLSKSRLLSADQCQKKLWLEVYEKDLLPEDYAEQTQFKVGREVGEVARQIYGPGLNLEDEKDFEKAALQTRSFIDSGQEGPIYEATFVGGGVLIRADVLERENDGLRIVEVKSSTQVKDLHVMDCAIQVWAIQQAGYTIDSIALAYVNNGFVYEGSGNYQGLLIEDDVTERVSALLPSVPGWVEAAMNVVGGEMPQVEVGAHCKSPYLCGFLEHCSQGQPEYPVSILSGRKIIERLTELGHVDLLTVPEAELDKDKDIKIFRSTTSGQEFIDPEVKTVLDALEFPRYYFDFETVAPAVPIWAGTRPYQALPFQWSCHVEQQDGVLTHYEHLATGDENPSRSTAESLIQTLGDTGPIIVYSSYEKTMLKGLREQFPDLEEKLNALIERLFDVLPVTREFYYHPSMKGSWSIKKVLPALAPDLDYSELEDIQHGNAAADAFLDIAKNEITGEVVSAKRQALINYCRLDTFAMVRVVRALSGDRRVLQDDAVSNSV